MLAKKSFLKLPALYLIAIIFVVLNLSNIRISGLVDIMPLFDLMMVFYFGVYKNLFGIGFIFLMGMWNDALCGNPITLTSLCYIILIKIFKVINSKVAIKDNFRQIWQQFIVFCLLLLVLKYLLLSMFNNSLYSLNNISIQFVLSVFFYVIMHKFFDYLNLKLLEE